MAQPVVGSLAQTVASSSSASSWSALRTVFVRTSTGKIFAFEIKRSSTLQDVQALVQEKTHIPVRRVVLNYEGRTLNRFTKMLPWRERDMPEHKRIILNLWIKLPNKVVDKLLYLKSFRNNI